MNDRDELLDDALRQGLAEANPYDPEALAAHVPARSGELMLAEITAPKRNRSPLRGLFRTPFGVQPAFGRAAFVGVLAAVAVAVVGLNVGLSRTNETDSAEPAEDASTPADRADGSAPLVVDPAPTSTAPNAEQATATSQNDADSEPDTAQDPDADDAETAGEGEAGEDPIVSPPVSDANSVCVSIEVEDFALTGGWRLGYDTRVSGGTFVTWEGLEPEAENTAPADVIEVTFTIDTPGTYRFVWAMRQPFEFGDESADSSWVNVPGAARFGPIDGGSYGGFVPIFGRAKGEFDWSAGVDVDEEQSEVGIVFDAPGEYTMQLAGRSHGHEIDRIVLLPDGLDLDAATTEGCAGG